MASRPVLAAALALLFAPLSPVSATEPVQHAALVESAVLREPAFAYRVVQPEKPDGRVLVLMHGSGGDETTLMSLAAKIAPGATLIGVRGRIVQDGVKRWYRRITATEFDQNDVRSEADALVEFLKTTATDLKLDMNAATFLGYSNGANLIAALTQLHPGLVKKAVLLRAMPVLAETPSVDLSTTKVLAIAGANDQLYFPYASRLEQLLRTNGASVDYQVIPAGHDIGDTDARIAAEWLARIGN
jgi:phospholipase/carboxylesterase